MQELAALVEKSGFKILSRIPVWVGLVGRIDKGLTRFPRFLDAYAQGLLILARKFKKGSLGA